MPGGPLGPRQSHFLVPAQSRKFVSGWALSLRTVTPSAEPRSLLANRARSCCWASAGRADTCGPNRPSGRVPASAAAPGPGEVPRRPRHFAYNPAAVPAEDLDEYERAYAAPGGLRALNYYRTHFIDAEHNQESAKEPLTIPVLALEGEGFLGPTVEQGMSTLAANVEGQIIPECGHWVADEQPEYVIAALRTFFAS
jgi:pimeloyl-ACP methyl ester carboxylesterase